MPNVKDEYEKGYADGRREAEYQNTHSTLDLFIRNLGYSPLKSDSVAYKEGFEKGLEDGLKEIDEK